jgi:hypothetical protein
MFILSHTGERDKGSGYRNLLCRCNHRGEAHECNLVYLRAVPVPVPVPGTVHALRYAFPIAHYPTITPLLMLLP